VHKKRKKTFVVRINVGDQGGRNDPMKTKRQPPVPRNLGEGQENLTIRRREGRKGRFKERSNQKTAGTAPIIAVAEFGH